MRSSKTYYLPEHVGFYSTNNSESLAVDLSQNIREILLETIKKEVELVWQFLVGVRQYHYLRRSLI